MATEHKGTEHKDTEHKGSFSTSTSTTVKPVGGEASLAGTEPVILDMGKKSKKSVRKLRKGKPGKLLSQVEEAIEHLRENGALTAGARPIIIVVREKDKKKGRRVAKMWGLG